MSFYDMLFNGKMKKITEKGIQNVPRIIEDYPFTQEDIEKLKEGKKISLQQKKVAKSKIIEELEQQKAEFLGVMKQWALRLSFIKYGKILLNKEHDTITGFTYSPNRKDEIVTFRDSNLNSAFIKTRYRLDKIDNNIFHEELSEMIEGTFWNYYQQLTKDLIVYCKGENGEKYVEGQLSIYENKYYIRQNVLLPSADSFSQTSETDVYIVTSKGIFVCEVKNWGGPGQMVKISKDGQWSIIHNDRREVKESPVAQNSRHCLATEVYLKSKGIEKIKINPLIIIGNEKVFVDNESSNAVIRVSEIYSYIEGLDLPEIYSDEEQKRIIALFEQCEIEERYFMVNDYVGTMKGVYSSYINRLFEYQNQKVTYIRKIEDYSRVIADELNKEWAIRNKKVRVLKIVLIVLAIIAGIIFVGHWWQRNKVLVIAVVFFYIWNKTKNW